MSQPDPAMPGQHPEVSLAAAEAQFDQGRRAYNSLLERITPWLFEIGSWVFGGLIAFTSLIMASLITVGPVDLPIKIATAAFAVALPLDVTGLILLRLVRDVQPVRFEQEIARVLQEASLTPGEQEVPSVAALEKMRTRGTRNVLNTALVILTVSCIVTLAAMGAALWHLAWWIAVAFVVMVFVCQLLVQIVLFTAQPRLSKEEKARQRRRRAEIVRQAKAEAEAQRKQAKAKAQRRQAKGQR